MLEKTVCEKNIKNGITYYFKGHENHDPTISAALTICTGSFAENEYESGIAHLLEHINMCFDKNGDYRQNYKFHAYAYTDYFETTYIIQTFPDSLGICSMAFKKIMSGEFINDDTFEEAMRDVIEEYNRKIPSVQNKILECVFNGTEYAKHPSIGEVKKLKLITVDMVRDFHRKWYGKRNIIISVNGDNKKIGQLCSKSCLHDGCKQELFRNQYLKTAVFTLTKQQYFICNVNEKPRISIVFMLKHSHMFYDEMPQDYIEYNFFNELCLDIIERTVKYLLYEVIGLQVMTDTRVLNEQVNLNILNIIFEADNQQQRVCEIVSQLFKDYKKVLAEIPFVLQEYEKIIQSNVSFRTDKWEIRNSVNNFLFGLPFYSEEMEREYTRTKIKTVSEKEVSDFLEKEFIFNTNRCVIYMSRSDMHGGTE